MNKICLTGRLTKDPELKSTTSGKSVCSFCIAVDRKFSKDKSADFINCTAWSGTAEFISKYFSKGKPIGVTGRLESRQYEKDGSKRTVWEVVVDDVEFIGNKGDSKSADDYPVIDDDESELPF